MLCKIENQCSIFWGDKHTSIEPDKIRGQSTDSAQAQDIAQQIGLKQVVFQHQVHGNTGLALTPDTYQSYRQLLSNGDYLITNIPRLAIGVLTADCLPMALFDPIHRAIGIVHAGWRGTVGHIGVQALHHMHTLYNTNIADVRIFFGPSAQSCCYVVDDPFIAQLPIGAQKFVVVNSGKKFFDSSSYNQHLFVTAGVRFNDIDRSNNLCTICTPNFCSYRLNPSDTIRQISIIGLQL